MPVKNIVLLEAYARETNQHYVKGQKLECHAADCELRIAKRNFARFAWKVKWPHHCPKCEGAGMHCYEYDPSPQGIFSLSPGKMQDCDPCQCIAPERAGDPSCCPRCGQPAWLPSDFDGQPVVCPFCDWKEDQPDACPALIDCFCWENLLWTQSII